jgi:hypothetical protein
LPDTPQQSTNPVSASAGHVSHPGQTLCRMSLPAAFILWKNVFAGTQRPPGRCVLQQRRDGRVAEGAGLLNRYTVKSRIGGSNPPLSAILFQRLTTKSVTCVTLPTQLGIFLLAGFRGSDPLQIQRKSASLVQFTRFFATSFEELFNVGRQVWRGSSNTFQVPR